MHKASVFLFHSISQGTQRINILVRKLNLICCEEDPYCKAFIIFTVGRWNEWPDVMHGDVYKTQSLYIHKHLKSYKSPEAFNQVLNWMGE